MEQAKRQVQRVVERLLMAIVLLFVLQVDSSLADVLVIRTSDGSEKEVVGEVLQEARDDSCLFQTPDGQLEIFTADQIVSKKIDIETVASMSHEELEKQLATELPDNFKFLSTKHYVIAYQTGQQYADWIKNLYERRLYRQFESFSKTKLNRFKLSDPKFPLVAIVFSSRPEYERHVKRTLGIEVGDMIAHYNQMTNRVSMYDLTFDLGGGDLKNRRRLEEVLSRPAAIPMVATIIHEGTHQLMHNRGMQKRMADRPLWLNEGMAIYFEAPALDNGRGWLNPGRPHPTRLAVLRQSLPGRGSNSLETLIGTDARFHGAEGPVAYAESWALIHFLLRRKPKPFRAYLKEMSEKKVAISVDAETRLSDFKKHFGDDMARLDREFLKFVSGM